MKKTDLHMHIMITGNLPKIGRFHLSGPKAIMRDLEFGLEFLETYADRLFFATDMVNSDMVFPLGAWLGEQVERGTLSREAYEKICWKNAERMFGI